MKKLRFLLLSTAIVAFSFMLVACGSKNDAKNNTAECIHQYDKWTVTLEATCANEGSQMRTCNICGLTETQEIPTLPHTEVVDSAIEATCTTDGKTEGKHCSVCNEIFVEQKTIPASHNYDEGSIVENATCTTEGSKKRVCGTCGDIITETIPKASHSYDSEIISKPATCTQNGIKKLTCSVCGHIETESISKLGHSPNAGYICENCGEKCPVELDLTPSEIEEAKKIEFISERDIDDLEDEKRFRLMFSLKDASENYLKVPVIVEIQIKNDNDEIVYNAIKIVKTNDYSVWSNNFGKKWTAAAIYIDYDDISGGTTERGTISFEVYNDYSSFNTSTLTIYDNLPLKPTTIILPELPSIIHDFDFYDDIDSSVNVTNITYEISGSSLYIYFSGEKTYDSKGSRYSQSCKIGWKLYDSEGYIVDSGTAYSPNIAVGEKFKDAKAYVSSSIKAGETYTLVISNVD